jgi:Rap1a immunity proteins
VRTFIISASLALALTQVGPAEGKEDSSSANAIMPGCRAFVKGELSSSYIEGYMQGECVGIIRGLVDAAYLQPLSPFCVPDDATNGQMVRVVVSYIDRHPERMHLRFSALAFDALKEAWPCKS